MNILPRMKILPLASLAILALASISSVQADVGSKNTASYVKAQIDKLDGKAVTLDVAMIRLLRPFTTNENFVLFGAMTVDDENHSGGGGILVVANKADKDKLVRRYGTTAERERGEGVESESMRGVLHLVNEDHQKYIYLDLTDGAFNPSEDDMRVIRGEAHFDEPHFAKGHPGKGF